LPQLSTAFPAERDENAKVDHDQIMIVPSTLTGDAKWEAVYGVAHRAGGLAAERCVPTPMKIVGFDVGNNHFRSGATIYASVESQSFDRAVAYAEAFAAVLHLNGVECSVESRLD
jgi:hypothetical protein